MAYLALARKWRPKTFSEVVGQTHVVQALSNALDSGRVHHAFLFTGTRGVGKTTLARIFAKSLNCESGTSAEPCQQCSTCLSIDEGRYVDLIEVDAASSTKVDDTRELLENVQYAPTMGKFKVYLIDEVHMLSGHSFNALLKTIEEPPEHVKFLFATTDPQKLPVTVLSRCLQFNLRAMRPEQVENQLVKILTKEGVEFDQPALQAIAKAADGSMRDGLSLLDQAIAQGGGSVLSADVENMLGTIKSQHTEAILSALAQRDIDSALAVISDMADNAVDFSQALDEVLRQLYYVSLAQVAPAALTSSDANQNLISKISQAIDMQTVQLYYQVGLISKRDIALAPSLRVGFEMALLRMLAFEPEQNPQAVISTEPKAQLESAQLERSTQLERSAQLQSSGEQASYEQTAQPVSAPAMQPAEPQTAQQTTAAQIQEPPQQAQNNQHQQQQTQQAPVQATPNENQVSAIAVTLAGNNEWGELLEQTDLQGFAKQLGMHCACERLTEERIDLALSPQTKHLFKEERLEQIVASLRATLNSNVNVHLEIEQSDKETPAECLERLGFERQEQTKDNMVNDPGVKALMSEFNATIDEQSIKPI